MSAFAYSSAQSSVDRLESAPGSTGHVWNGGGLQKSWRKLSSDRLHLLDSLGTFSMDAHV